MGVAQWIALAVALQRFAETIISGRNRRRLLESGAREVGQGHYPLIVLLHVSWLAALFFLIPPQSPVHPGFLGTFLVLQCLRVWTMVSLGRFWTTRIVTLPGAELSARGPYRWVRHPNYMIVAAEIAVLPLAFGAWEIAAMFSILNAGLLAWRISVEDEALRERRNLPNSH